MLGLESVRTSSRSIEETVYGHKDVFGREMKRKIIRAWRKRELSIKGGQWMFGLKGCKVYLILINFGYRVHYIQLSWPDDSSNGYWV